MKHSKSSALGLLLGLIILITGCNFPFPGPAEVVSPQTLAARTMEAALTQLDPDSGSLLITPTDQDLESAAEASSTPRLECVDRAVFVEDLTVRDRSEFEPNQAFVKIWRLRNEGTCTWTQQYTLTFIGGQSMGAATEINLTEAVLPGNTIDLSIDLQAPVGPGAYQGFWKLRADDNTTFGIGPSGDQSFWVKIVVLDSMVANPSPAVSATAIPSVTTFSAATASPGPTPSPTTTPEIESQGEMMLEQGSSFDLDAGELNPDSGFDLLWGESTPDVQALIPESGSQLQLLPPESGRPDHARCRTEGLVSIPYQASQLSPGWFLCYQTDEGRFGWLEIIAFDESFTFRFQTWRSE